MRSPAEISGAASFEASSAAVVSSPRSRRRRVDGLPACRRPVITVLWKRAAAAHGRRPFDFAWVAACSSPAASITEVVPVRSNEQNRHFTVSLAESAIANPFQAGKVGPPHKVRVVQRALTGPAEEPSKLRWRSTSSPEFTKRRHAMKAHPDVPAGRATRLPLTGVRLASTLADEIVARPPSSTPTRKAPTDQPAQPPRECPRPR